VALALGDPRAAARLFGATEALMAALRISLYELGDFDDSIALARAGLGAEAFETAYGDGARLDLDDALAEAEHAFSVQP
jgi:hypothetical protein